MKILIFLLLILSGCATGKNQDYFLNQFRDLAITDSITNSNQFLLPKNDIFKYYHQNKVEWLDDDNVVKSYTYSKRKLGPLSYVPLLSFFLPRNYQNYEIIITLKNGSIASIRSFDHLITLESESNCNEAIFSCVTNIK